MDFHILGRLEVYDEEGPVRLHGRKQRALLAFLLLHRGEWISSDVLVDALWGADVPKTARAALQNYVAQLRRVLGPEILASRDGGYELAVADEQIDVARFERLAGEARRTDGSKRVERLREALALWRGPPLADLAYEPFASHEAVRLEELRLTALEDLAAAELALGGGPELIERLETLVAEEPFRERFRAQLMLALYRGGRQVEALEVYQRTRRTLLDELGIEPGSMLRDLEQAILRQDESLQPPAVPAREEPGPLEERRKLVTVLFADMSYPETLDPELLRETSVRALKAIRAALDRHGATVEQRASDEVMAVFGIPLAHEDDALRAARAALEIQAAEIGRVDAAGQRMNLRVAIESGEVLAGVDETGHGFVSGAVVTVAKRLLDGAESGEVLVGSATLALLGHRVIAEPKPDTPASVIVALADGGQAPLLPREEPPFAGRTTELRTLHAAFDDVVETRAARLFLLLGEAGIGKTRLARELTTQLAERATITRGRCLSYGQALTYWPLIEALRPLGKPAAPALEQLVAGGASSPQQLAWHVQQALERAAQERPLLVVVEDLHWAERALLDLLELVGDLSRNASILLLVLARPELLEQHPDWSRPESSLLLEPLTHGDSLSLVSHLEPAIEPAARERVLERAAGNPLFLEELSAFVAERGVDGDLPPRIHALLQARLDLLPEPERVLLARASLAGTEFHSRALEALSPDELRAELPARLERLTRKLLIRPTGVEEVFRFRHQLIRDTAYGTLPKSDRASLHERFAGWLEQSIAERPELDEIRAYHLEQATLAKGELGVSDPALQERAAVALVDAGERARARTDLRAAADLWRRALPLLDEHDTRVPELKLRLVLVLAPLGDLAGAQRLLGEAARDATDPVLAAAIRLAVLHAQLQFEPEGIPPAVRRETATAIPLFEQREESRYLALAWATLGEAEWIELRLNAATEAWERAAEHAERVGDAASAAYVLSARLLMLPFRLPWSTVVDEAERLATRFPGEPIVERAVGFLRAVAAYEAGRRDEARARAEDVLDRIRRSYPLHTAIFNAFFGWEEMHGGDVAEAERRALGGIAELEGLTERGFRSGAETILGEIRIEQGRHREALELADEAEEHGGPHDRGTLIAANAVRARAHAALGENDEAKAAAETAVAVAEETDSLADQARAKYALAVALRAAGELVDARAAAEDVVRLHTYLERPLFGLRAAALVEQIERDMKRPKRRRRERSLSV
ncbi:MAG TPA: BTAD domain-containing putative transcriptional regulator [Gaiellaceae bacterium]|nr:BTAD domain-containing putative transcriptional regulator [Gaiellaceae bacterium]HET8650944.1 BTAD domain-containing putative transcriptional regulator [Gaiellaceae bacterium]